MKLSVKNTIVLSLLAATAMLNQACSDTELALGSGVVIGAIIAHDGDHHHHEGYRDGYHDGYHDGRHERRRYYSVSLDLDVENTLIDARANAIAEKYDISVDAANQLILTLEQIKAGQISASEQIGLQKTDIVDFMKGKELSANAIDAMSIKLDMTTDETLALVADIQADVKESMKVTQPSPIPGH